MFVYYACCDAELESSIKVISGDLLGAYDDVGIAIAPMLWSGSNFTLASPTVAGVGGRPEAGTPMLLALSELALSEPVLTNRPALLVWPEAAVPEAAVMAASMLPAER